MTEYEEYMTDLKKEFVDKFKTVGVECLPDGWRATLVEPLINELFDVLGFNSQYFLLLDIKEKYGSLRVYWDWEEEIYQSLTDETCKTTLAAADAFLAELYDKIEAIIRKYEKKSSRTCVRCGKSKNVWIDSFLMLPLCKHCSKLDKRHQKT